MARDVKLALADLVWPRTLSIFLFFRNPCPIAAGLFFFGGISFWAQTFCLFSYVALLWPLGFVFLIFCMQLGFLFHVSKLLFGLYVCA